MSMFPDHLDIVSLHVATGNPMAEVFLIDHSFAMIDRSVGDLHCEVPPGVYKVKVRLGDDTEERLVVLNDDQSIDMTGELVISSPAPIFGTSRTHEPDVDAAREASQHVAYTAGAGATILLMRRHWGSPQAHSAVSARRLRRWETPARLSLRLPDGTMVADLDEVSQEVGSAQEPARVATIEVDPGIYVLHWYDDDEELETAQAVHAVANWQTQVFLLQEPDEGRGDRYSVSMLMSRHGFDPGDAMAHMVEVARLALAEERKVASELVTESLFAKLENPMLGLFGAHLMLIAAQAERKAAQEQLRYQSRGGPFAPLHFRQQEFDLVVASLADLLGHNHPDVVALLTKTSHPDLASLAPVTTPPLLWCSWLLLLEASHDYPPLVPADTWRQASRPLAMRPFLAWAVAGEESDDLETELAAHLGRVLDIAAPHARERFELPRQAGIDRGAASTDHRRRQLSRQLLIPRAAIDHLAEVNARPTAAGAAPADPNDEAQRGKAAIKLGHNERDMALGGMIKALRLRKGLTQSELAERMGTTDAAIDLLEAGGRTPSLDTLQSLTETLGEGLIIGFENDSGGVQGVTLWSDQSKPDERIQDINRISTKVLGLVIPDVDNPFYYKVAAGAEEAARANDYLLIVANSNSEARNERNLLRSLCERGVDGLLVIAAPGADHEFLSSEFHMDKRVVFIDRPPQHLEADFVTSDNVGGARKAVEHLIDQGHERIGMLVGDTRVWTDHERLQGYKDALADRGFPYDPALVKTDCRDFTSAEKGTYDLFELSPPPTAIFAYNNRSAIGASRAIKNEQATTALVGFDEFELADMLSLTVVNQDTQELGKFATGTLLRRLKGEEFPIENKLFETTLIERDSGQSGWLQRLLRKYTNVS
jgi:LacI family transcriptional regulator, galactose operon repressor